MRAAPEAEQMLEVLRRQKSDVEESLRWTEERCKADRKALRITERLVSSLERACREFPDAQIGLHIPAALWLDYMAASDPELAGLVVSKSSRTKAVATLRSSPNITYGEFVEALRGI